MMIRVVDLETCGLEPPAPVCEIGWSDLVPDGASWIVGPPAHLLVDPGQAIPPETSAVHHITDEDVRGAPSFAEAARACFFDEERMQADRLVLVAHNAKFERQWLTPEVTGEVHWICTYRCALRVWPDAPNHQNNTLRYWLKLPVDRRKAEPTHRAGPDAYVTAFLMKALLNNASIGQLIQWSNEPALQVRCQFGKHRGTPWKDVPTDYLHWCTRQQMDEDVAFTVQSELRRRSGRA